MCLKEVQNEGNPYLAGGWCMLSASGCWWINAALCPCIPCWGLVEMLQIQHRWPCRVNAAGSRGLKVCNHSHCPGGFQKWSWDLAPHRELFGVKVCERQAILGLQGHPAPSPAMLMWDWDRWHWTYQMSPWWIRAWRKVFHWLLIPMAVRQLNTFGALGLPWQA